MPEGNPTSLVVMSCLGLSPGQFLGHLFVPGLFAAVLCVAVPLGRLGERTAPVAGARPGFVVPWRIGAQMTGLR